MRVEPRRQRRAAAIAAYRETLDLRQELKEKLPRRNKQGAIEAFVATAIDQYHGDDGDQHEVLSRYLNYWETIAAAALRGVIDVTVLNAIAGSTIRDLCNDYQLYIEAVQKDQPVAFKQLTLLNDKLLPDPYPGARRAWLALTRRLP